MSETNNTAIKLELVRYNAGESDVTDIIASRAVQSGVSSPSSLVISCEDVQVNLPLTYGVYDWYNLRDVLGTIPEEQRAAAVALMPVWMGETGKLVVDGADTECNSMKEFVAWLGSKEVFQGHSLYDVLEDAAADPEHPLRKTIEMPEGVALNKATLPYIDKHKLVTAISNGTKIVQTEGGLYGYCL